MTATYNWIISKINLVLTWFYDFFLWILDYLHLFLFKVIQEILNAILSTLQAIPRPSIFTTVESDFCSNFSQLGSIASGLDIGVAMSLIMSAYTIRFIIRRLPFIG